MSYLVKLEVFEGPFDLLLSLIEQAEIDILDIPIAQITEEYLAYLRKMQELDLVVSGDFLVIAATLLQIKAKMLLPSKPVMLLEDDEEEDPREALVERLMEYKFYKEIAERLHNQSEQTAFVYPRCQTSAGEKKLPIFVNPVGDVDVDILNKLFAQVVLAINERKRVRQIERKISLPTTIRNVRITILKRQNVTFSELLVAKERQFIVVTFLAVLELIRNREIIVVQDHDLGEIYITGIRQVEEEAGS